MPTAAPPRPAAPSSTSSSTSSPADWIHAHPKGAAAAGVGAVAALALLKRKSAGSAPKTLTPASVVSGGPQDVNGYNSIASDVYNSLEGQLASLQSQIGAVSAAGSAAPPAAPPPGTTPPPPPPGTPPPVGPPLDRYSVGQLVNPASGEKIVSAVFSPLYGWVNETNKGGAYTGGGGSQGIGALPYGGSYLGFVQNRYGSNPGAAAAEMGTHGTFGAGGLSLLPGGGYEMTNSRGEHYQFGH